MPRHGWLLAFLLACTLGCRQTPPEPILVTGKISYRGLTLRSGMIVFTPDVKRGHSGAMATSAIGDDGTYNLQTGTTLGAAPGWYRVTVAALTAPALTAPASPAPGSSFSIPRSILPEKYRDPELSQLTCEITAGPMNVINFDLD